MANLKAPIDVEELKIIKLADLKKEYRDLSNYYERLRNGKWLYCHRCGEYQTKENFYSSRENKSGYFHYCKKCCLEIAEGVEKKGDQPNLTKESMMKLLKMMNLPYIDSVFNSCVEDVENAVGQKNRSSPALQYLVIIKSLPQYNKRKWDSSEFPIEYENSASAGKVKQSTIKRFGNGLSSDEYLFLQTQYDDWVSRYECKTKAQEELFERLSWKKLEIFKATRENKSTKDLDKSYQELMSTANITPRQNSSDILTEGMTLGQLIEKWENENPIPEPEEELKDVDNLGLYLDVFFKGHMAKLLNLKNPLQHIYESFMKRYTVNKPEYDEESDSEEIFDKIFGNSGEK